MLSAFFFLAASLNPRAAEEGNSEAENNLLINFATRPKMKKISCEADADSEISHSSQRSAAV